MSRRRRILAAGLSVLSLLAVAGRVQADATQTLEDLERKVKRVAPRIYTLPGKVLCSCPAATGSYFRPVGYLNHTLLDNGLNTRVVVMYAYSAFSNATGNPAYISACSDYKLME